MTQAAFYLSAGRLAGITGWMQTERYEVEGIAPGASTFEAELELLRALQQ